MRTRCMTSTETESLVSRVTFKYGDNEMEFVRQSETESLITSVNIIDQWGELRVLCMCPDDRAASIIIDSLRVVFATEDSNLMAKIESYHDGFKEMDKDDTNTNKKTSTPSSPTEDSSAEEASEVAVAS